VRSSFGSSSSRSRLRAATRREHATVDRLFSRFDLSRRDGYRAFLTATAAAHLGIEEALEAAGVGKVVGDWPQRRRAALLNADLEALGGTAPPPVPPPQLASEAEILGTLYVLEGSRLGGSLLSKRIGERAPARFLSAPARSGAWRELLRLLDESLDSGAKLDEAVAAARACFRCYALAAARKEPALA
jgi:heme oxygenase